MVSSTIVPSAWACSPPVASVSISDAWLAASMSRCCTTTPALAAAPMQQVPVLVQPLNPGAKASQQLVAADLLLGQPLTDPTDGVLHHRHALAEHIGGVAASTVQRGLAGAEHGQDRFALGRDA